jgi:dipeptidyl aminopeptidase/acylaminoacyl peptidase
MGGTACITLQDVLDVKYLGKWEWSPCGRWIAWIHDAGGVGDVWLGEPSTGKNARLTSAKDGVSDFAWRPGEAVSLALVIDGGLFVAEQGGEEAGGGEKAGGGEAAQGGTACGGAAGEDAAGGRGAAGFSLRRLVARKDQHGSLTWSPDGRALAYGCAGSAWLYRADEGEHVELKLPGRLIPAGHGGNPLSWSKDGKLLACGVVGQDHVPQIVVLDGAGGQVWLTLGTDPAVGAAWLDEGTLLYRVLHNMGGDVDFYLVSFSPAQAEHGAPPSPHVRRICQAPGDGRGPALMGTAAPSPDGTQILLLLENDGYAHHYLYSLETGGLEQVTFGECEDFGHAGDEAAWTPDGNRVVFASNRGDSGCRHLWALEVSTGELAQLTGGRVTDVQPKPSPDGRRLAYVHCDEYRNMDIWVAGFDQGRMGESRQLSCSMPAAWTPDNQVVPEEVTYQGAEGWTIHAQLYLPRGCSAADRPGIHPGLVWVHGGPIRQLRPGWHPMRSYALFHAYHQYLLQKGYVVLTVNYRGGIGYGRAFRHGLYHKMGVNDVLDVVEGGRFLKRLPCVDPARVAVWGLSYGGYMTLHALTQYPEEFAMGVNVAGIWDFGQWDRWMESRGRRPTWSRWYLGGRPEEAPELYRQGSPCSFKDGLARPLINVQGTQDANVDFAQLDRIVQDCVGLGREYEAYYYPQEVHTFRHKCSWMDVLPKIEREFEKRLSPKASACS